MDLPECAPQLLNRLAQIYIAPGTTFAPDETPQGYITRITVEHIHGIGPWSERDRRHGS